MKKILLSTLFLGLTCYVLAQTPIPNGGMETWTNVGSNNEEPTEWNSLITGSLCGLCGFGAQQVCFRESGAANIHSGTYSAKIQTKTAVGNTINGVMTLGRVFAPSTTPSQGYNATVTTDPNFSEAIVSQPDSLVFWAKYVPVDGTDSARVSVYVHDAYNLRDPQDAASVSHVRSSAVKNFRTGGNWVRISMPFTIVNSAVASQYILVSFTSSKTPGVGSNGTTLYIDDVELIYRFNNSIAPAASQNISINTPGSTLTVTESQTAVSRNWKYASQSGGPYTSFGPTATASTFQPIFSLPGTYYVVCESVNANSETAISNEVIVVVGNGTVLSTTTASGSPYLLSANAQILSNVDFTANAVFSAGNVFTAQLSDANGSFANPVTIGTLNGTSVGTINTQIPNYLPNGTGYRVRVVSSNPSLTGTDNGTNLTVIQFENSISPMDTQYVQDGVNGNTLTVAATHSSTQEWYHRPNIFAPYVVFSPAETGVNYTPNFSGTTVQFVQCRSVNTWNDTVTSADVVIFISPNTGTNALETAEIRSYWSGEELVLDMTRSDLSTKAQLQILDVNGRMLLSKSIPDKNLYRFETELSAGVYIIQIIDSGKRFSAQTIKQ